jgi:hypothetical protein
MRFVGSEQSLMPENVAATLCRWTMGMVRAPKEDDVVAENTLREWMDKSKRSKLTEKQRDKLKDELDVAIGFLAGFVSAMKAQGKYRPSSWWAEEILEGKPEAKRPVAKRRKR